MPKMMEVNPSELVEKVSGELEKEQEIKAPEWAAFVKTGRSKERPPVRQDWWHVRAAAILRSVAKLGPIGVSKLRVKYGSKKNRGHKPERFYRGSGSIARDLLQQLEKAGLVRQSSKGAHKGRVITQKAAQLLNKAAVELHKKPSGKSGPSEKKAKSSRDHKKQEPQPAESA